MAQPGNTLTREDAIRALEEAMTKQCRCEPSLAVAFAAAIDRKIEKRKLDQEMGDIITDLHG